MMRDGAITSTVSNQPLICQAEVIAPSQDNPLALLAQWRKEAVDECGWKQSALAAHLGVSEHYLSRMLSGAKPFPDRHVVRLPREIQIRIATKFLEHVGHIVVPPVTQADCDRYLAMGLFGRLRAVWAVTPTPLKASVR
jgi:hypothetical protein